MASVDLRAVTVGLVVAAVALFGEVGWPLIYLVSGILLTVVAVVSVADKRLRFGHFDFLWLGLIAWGVIAAVLVSGNALASKTTLASWTAAWLVWTAVANAGPAGRRIVSWLLLIAAVALGCSIVVGLIGLPGLISNPNIVVALIVSAVPLTTFHSENPWLVRVAIVLMLVPVLLTGSRAGVLAVLGIGLVFWPESRNRWWAIGLGGAGAISVVVWRLISRPDSLAWHRWRIWGAIVESIGDRPLLGIGAAGLGQAMGPYRLEHAAEVGRWGHVIGSAENMVLGLAVRVGLPGLALTAAAIVVWAVARRRPGITSNAVLMATVTMSMFHDFWSEPAVLWWWAAVFGLLTLRGREVAIEQLSGADVSRKAMALAIGAIVAWALVQSSWSQWLWSHREQSPESVDAAVKAEPWLAEPVQWRIESLLAERQWTWSRASEALNLSHRLVGLERGSAAAWGLFGKVNGRIVDQFGAWPETVKNVRRAFSRASELEPRLPWYPYDLALLERGLGNTEVALTLVKRSLELEPAFVRGWLLLARLELDQGRLGEAQAAFKSGLAARHFGEPNAGIVYHHDLILCPEWQLQEIRRALE